MFDSLEASPSGSRSIKTALRSAPAAKGIANFVNPLDVLIPPLTIRILASKDTAPPKNE